MAGYSGTPLVKKLGVKENHRVALIDAPDGFLATLTPLLIAPGPSAGAVSRCAGTTAGPTGTRPSISSRLGPRSDQSSSTSAVAS